MAARWPLFAGVVGTVLFLLVALARLSATTVTSDRERPRSANGGAIGVDDSDGVEHRLRDDSERVRPQPDESGRSIGDLESMSTGALLANVALSQGVLGVVLLFGAWYAEIPPAAFGVAVGNPWNLGLPALGVGLAFGVALYVGNELLGTVVEDLGIDFSEELREVLAPETAAGWLTLLVVVLPAIAVFEELLFRAALVGALAAGFGVSPWLLAILSSVAFAIGHGMQGPGGVLVTGLLGFVLAAAFVLTGSLLVVVVAHYVVNAFEFVIHEGLGWDPLRNEEGP